MGLEPADNAREVVLVLWGEGLDGGDELRPYDEELAKGWRAIGEGEVGRRQGCAVLGFAGEGDRRWVGC